MQTGRSTLLVLLDLDAASETVDHSILSKCLENWLGLPVTSLNWFETHLEKRGVSVSRGNFISET